MFILRRISEDHSFDHTCLGMTYKYLLRDLSFEEFDKVFQQQDLPSFPEQPFIFGFIIYSSAGKVIPLYKSSTYYVMMSDGKTFDTLNKVSV